MSATPVSKRELVRLLVIEHGQKRASELSGEPYEKVRKWTQRGDWLASQSVPTSATVDNVQSELQRLERETKLSLAKSAARMSHEATEAKLNESGHVLNVGKVASIVHRWEAKDQAQQNVVVNVALLGIDPSTVAVQTLDVESECQGSGD